MDDETVSDTGRQSGSRGRLAFEYVLLAVVAIVVALAIQAFLVKPYRIPSGSMEDTLLIGDRVLVDRVSWRFSDPERGDVVVFHPPFAGPVLIKRIIALPGEVIAVRDGEVTIDGQPLREDYIRRIDGQPEPTDPFSNGLAWSLQQPYRVPAGSYYVMGDNRTDSGDSREFGAIARNHFIGQAFARYWPPSRIGQLR